MRHALEYSGRSSRLYLGLRPERDEGDDSGIRPKVALHDGSKTL